MGKTFGVNTYWLETTQSHEPIIFKFTKDFAIKLLYIYFSFYCNEERNTSIKVSFRINIKNISIYVNVHS